MKRNILIILATYFIYTPIFSQNPQDNILFFQDSIIPSYVKILPPKTKSIKNRSNKDRTIYARNLLKDNLKLNRETSCEVIDSFIDPQNNYHIFFMQYYNGLKVEGTRFGVHFSNDEVESINGNFRFINSLNTIPKISESQALSKALSFINADEYMWENPDIQNGIKENKEDATTSYYPQGELVICFDRNDNPTLAYKFDIYANIPFSRTDVYVDAHTGEIANSESQLHFNNGIAATRYYGQRSIQTQYYQGKYRLHDYSRGNGIVTYNINFGGHYSNTDYLDNDNNWTAAEWHNTTKDDAALNVHWASEMTFDYFKNTFNRNGYDNNGGIIRGYVNANLNLIDSRYNNSDNAFWNVKDKTMTYGMGSKWDSATPLDIVAHEISHGICQSTAALKYEAESGALNEAFSDIWAACVEHYAIPEKGIKIWIMGEDIGWIIRAMNSPMTYQKGDWIDPNNIKNDYGGVHTNSGVLNYWFYLLSEGGNGKNANNSIYFVTAIGMDKAAQIAYRALTVYLNSTSNYREAKTYTLLATADLFGYSSNEYQQVINAWFAVGVGTEDPYTILGPDIICNCETQTYTIKNIPQDATITWSSEFGNLVSEQGTATATFNVINEGGYPEPVTAIINKGGLSKTITRFVHVGIPETEYIDYESSPFVGEDVLVEAVVSGATEYKWTKAEGNCVIIPSDKGDKASIVPTGTQPIKVIFTASNRCGTWEEWIKMTATMRKNGQSLNTEIPHSVSIYTLSYELVYSAKNLISPFNIQTARLQPGYYVIELVTNNEIIRKKIYIEN